MGQQPNNKYLPILIDITLLINHDIDQVNMLLTDYLCEELFSIAYECELCMHKLRFGFVCIHGCY